MNHEILTAALDSIDVTLVEEHVNEKSRLKIKRHVSKALRTLGSAAACLAIFALAITVWDSERFGNSGTDANPPGDIGQITTTPTDGSSAPTDNGEKITLTFGGKTYNAFLYPDNSPADAVPESKLGEYLGNATVRGLGEATECEIYSVADRDDALAVRLPSGEYALALIPRTDEIN